MSSKTGDQDRENATILIVDDKPDNLRLLINMLAKHGYTVRPAISAGAALKFLDTQTPDLILLDGRMPGMDGYQLCSKLKENPATQDLPVIFISAGDRLTDKTKAFACGCVDYITKPFEEEEVSLRVRTHLSLHSLRKNLEERVKARTAELAELSARLERRVQERTSELEAALRELSEANHRLLSLSVIDGLTGVKNRRYFDEYLVNEWEHAKRARKPLSLLVIDIDHFKAVNDSFGHQVGDECLKLVAKVVEGSIKRRVDQVARYGGEEFAVILPDTPSEGAMLVAEEIRSRIEQTILEVDRSAVRLTASIGLCTASPATGQTCTELLANADRALYHAKHCGRNRVERCVNETSPS